MPVDDQTVALPRRGFQVVLVAVLVDPAVHEGAERRGWRLPVAVLLDGGEPLTELLLRPRLCPAVRLFAALRLAEHLLHLLPRGVHVLDPEPAAAPAVVAD